MILLFDQLFAEYLNNKLIYNLFFVIDDWFLMKSLIMILLLILQISYS